MSNKNEKPSVAPKTENAIVPVQAEVLATVPVNTLAGLMEVSPKAFLDKYRDRIIKAGTTLPTYPQIQGMLQGLPEKYSKPLMSVLNRTMGDRDGVYTDETINSFPELRLFQGTGNDPNRPENTIPGQFYLTSKESVGKAFEGTPLAVWTGSTMWPPKDAEGLRVPVCHSMNRTIGSTFGECAKCPNKPFRDGKQTLCGNDVVAFFLSKDLNDIVLVRFAKTSEPAGKQLLNFIARSEKPWSRWYSISSTSKTSTKDASRRWFTFNVSPQEGEASMVPQEIWGFCDAAKCSIEATFILPAMAQIYRQAELAMAGDDVPVEAEVVTSTSSSLGNWGGNENV